MVLGQSICTPGEAKGEPKGILPLSPLNSQVFSRLAHSPFLLNSPVPGTILQIVLLLSSMLISPSPHCSVRISQLVVELVSSQLNE